jgi:O-antigen ligase
VQGFRSIYTNYVLFPALALFTASFPLPIAYNSVFTILLFIVFLADLRNIKNNILVYFSDVRNILLLIIFLSIFFSIFYSEDAKAGIRGILAAVPLIVVPLVMTTANALSSRQIDILKKIFVFSCLITSIIYFIQTGIRIGLFDGSYNFKPRSLAYQSPYLVYNLTYHQLTPSIHAVFFSLYLAFAILIIIFGFERKTRLSKILHALMIFYFAIFLILLTSVTINFALYSFIIAIIFFKFSFKRPVHYLLFFGLVIIATAITDYLLIVKYIGPDIGNIIYKFDSPSINQKIIFSFIAVILLSAVAIIIKLFFKKKHSLLLGVILILTALTGIIYLKNEKVSRYNNDQKINNISVRASYSKEALRIIKKHPLVGVGIGDKKYKLIERDMTLGNERYFEFGRDTMPDDVFNPHNQFLDFWISAGILPVICLLLFFLREFINGLRNRHIIYLGLTYCFFLFCFTDKAMMVQRGQIFFLFFICLLQYEIKTGTTKR